MSPISTFKNHLKPPVKFQACVFAYSGLTVKRWNDVLLNVSPFSSVLSGLRVVLDVPLNIITVFKSKSSVFMSKVSFSFLKMYFCFWSLFRAWRFHVYWSSWSLQAACSCGLLRRCQAAAETEASGCGASPASAAESGHSCSFCCGIDPHQINTNKHLVSEKTINAAGYSVFFFLASSEDLCWSADSDSNMWQIINGLQLPLIKSHLQKQREKPDEKRQKSTRSERKWVQAARKFFHERKCFILFSNVLSWHFFSPVHSRIHIHMFHNNNKVLKISLHAKLKSIVNQLSLNILHSQINYDKK